MGLIRVAFWPGALRQRLVLCFGRSLGTLLLSLPEALSQPHPSFGADHMPASFRLFEEMNYQQSVLPLGPFSGMALK